MRPDLVRAVIRDEPVAKARPRVTIRAGRVHGYTPSKTAKAEWRIEQYLRDALATYDKPAFLGAVRLTATVYVRPPASTAKRDHGRLLPAKRPDVENYAKLLMDACSTALLWRDDAQVIDLVISKRYAWDGEPRWDLLVEKAELEKPAPVPNPGFCSTPGACAGKAACPREYACND